MKAFPLIAIGLALTHAQEWESQHENSMMPTSTDAAMPEVQTLLSFVSNRPKVMRVSDLMAAEDKDELKEDALTLDTGEEELDEEKASLALKVLELIDEDANDTQNQTDSEDDKEETQKETSAIEKNDTKGKTTSNEEVNKKDVEEAEEAEQQDPRNAKEAKDIEEQEKEEQDKEEKDKEEQDKEEQEKEEQEKEEQEKEEQDKELEEHKEKILKTKTTKPSTKGKQQLPQGTDIMSNVDSKQNANVTQAFADKDSDSAELLSEHEETSFLDVGTDDDEEQEDEEEPNNHVTPESQTRKSQKKKQSGYTDLIDNEEEEEEEDEEVEEEEEEEEPESTSTDTTLKAAAFDVNSYNYVNRWDELPPKNPNDSPFSPLPDRSVDMSAAKKNATVVQYNAKGNQSASSSPTEVNFFSSGVYTSLPLSWIASSSLIVFSVFLSYHA
ncbi:hypothetical protein BD560DRAFT_487101 [Blakeslea trispora]|nr:hypothetical protein BD560DRAFT_487101 [Blakeslea trispora]